MKKGERKGAWRRPRGMRESWRDVAWRLGIAIRNAAVAIADHSEATVRIAISWRVLRQNLAQLLNVSSPHTIRIINLPYLPSHKSISFRNFRRVCLLCRSALGLGNKPRRDVSRLLPFLSPSPSPTVGWLIAKSAA